jgi:hypothetical protein
MIYEDFLNEDSEEEQLERTRKVAAALAATLVALEEAEKYTTKYKVIDRRPNEVRVRDEVVKQIRKIASDKPQLFKKMYRLGVAEFDELKGLISPGLEQYRKYTLHPIPSEIYLAVCLRWLAGGSYHDLSFGYNLPDNTIHQIVFKVLKLINSTVDNIRFPIDDEVALQKLSDEFNRYTN